jgi:hypothetical protein
MPVTDHAFARARRRITALFVALPALPRPPALRRRRAVRARRFVSLPPVTLGLNIQGRTDRFTFQTPTLER